MDNIAEKYPEIFDYILQEEQDFKTRTIPLASNWDWNMFKHIDMSYSLKNSQYLKGTNGDYQRPFKNIILPIANVNYRSEGFDVKDAELYVDNAENYHLSLLSRKFHARWAVKYSVDTAIDESVTSYFDYGLTLVQNVNEKRPQVIDLKADLAFCNQSDVLSGPICLKYSYSMDELEEMKGKWDDAEIDRAITMSSFSSKDSEGKQTRSPNKSVDVYVLYGVFPVSWLKKGEEDKGKYSRQMHVVTYYTDVTTDDKKGITLWSGKQKRLFKALQRDKIAKRACGRGGIEELFHPSIWTNYSEIHLQQMLEASSKVITKTTDKNLAQKNNMNGVKHGQTVFVEDGKTWEQMVIQPFNKAAFDNYVNAWEQNARVIGSASDPQLGLNPVSGTPLGTTEIVTNQGEGIHEYRRGQIATFWGEIYRDWVLQYITDDLNSGDTWMDELSLEELKEVAELVATKGSNKRIKEIVFSDKTLTPEDQAMLTALTKEAFMKGGKNKFMKVMEKEFSQIPLQVKFNIAGKQKNLAETVNKLNGVFRTVFANPAILQAPGMSELFNHIIEASGFSPIDFSSLTTAPPQQQPQPGAVTSPMQLLELNKTP